MWGLAIRSHDPRRDPSDGQIVAPRVVRHVDGYINPKKLAAALRISFARRSSRFSRSSCFIRARSSLPVPAAHQRRSHTRRTHWRSVSWFTVSFLLIDSIAFHCVGYGLDARTPSAPHAA